MMKKWLFLILTVSLLSGCTRYNPEIKEERRPVETEENRAAALQMKVTFQFPFSPAEFLLARLDQTLSQRKDLIKVTDEAGTRFIARSPVKVRGIYVSAHVAGTPAFMEPIISQIDKTELNAVVIDFKTDEGYIASQVDSPAFQEIHACRDYIPDMTSLMETLKAHDIYTIARVVAFKDPYLAEQKPEWSLKRRDGSIYRDKKGLAWVNPYKTEVWDYLIEAGAQAAAAGFDEVQFDYIRFATDSTMREVVFDEADTRGRSKTDVVTEFTEYAYKKLAPLGIFVSADVFGAIIGSEADASAVGQIYGEMSRHMDYICPMIYPSHYGDGNFGLDHPDLHPYETILGALTKSAEELNAYESGEIRAAVRPWLQDFTASYLKHYQKYGDEELREQIQAVYDAGYEEWILWNAANHYHYGGLLDESDTEAGGAVPALQE